MLLTALALQAVAHAAFEVRKNGPGVSIYDAYKMSPEQLAEALLKPGHPAIDAAMVNRMVLLPPPPPGAPHINVIRLYATAKPSPEAGFCERKVAAVYLNPVVPIDRLIPPAAANHVEVETVYQWRGSKQDKCSGGIESYFDPTYSLVNEQAFEVIRMFHNLQEQLIEYGSSVTEISVIDTAAGEWRRSAKDNGDHDMKNDDLTTLTDPKKAVVLFPLKQVGWVADGTRAAGSLLTPGDMELIAGGAGRAFYLSAGVWSASLITKNSNILVARISRAIPAPF